VSTTEYNWILYPYNQIYSGRVQVGENLRPLEFFEKRKRLKSQFYQKWPCVTMWVSLASVYRRLRQSCLKLHQQSDKADLSPCTIKKHSRSYVFGSLWSNYSGTFDLQTKILKLFYESISLTFV